MIDRVAGATYESLNAGFEWQIPERLNIGTACADLQEQESLALIEVVDGQSREHTFGDLTRASNRLANGLRELGVQRGDRVAIMLPQGFACGISHLATYKSGAIAVPLTQLFGPQALDYRIGDSGARVVITDTTSLDLVVEVTREMSDVVIIVAGADQPDQPDLPDHSGQSAQKRPHFSLQGLLASSSEHFDADDTASDDPAIIIYTSGTTGSPKGALHAHRVLLGHLPGFELMFDHFPRDDDRIWTPADWAWIGGLFDVLLPAWFHGRPVIATPRARFDPESALRLMAEHQVTATFLPPTALKMMRQANLPEIETSLRVIMSGGEPLGSETLAWSREQFGVEINEIYGQTEANLLVGNSSAVWGVRPGSMGRPYPGHRVAILDFDGGLAAPECEGEIVLWAEDPVVMLGYWNNPEATENKFLSIPREPQVPQDPHDTQDPGRPGEDPEAERWLRTGDLGRMDEDGYLWFSSREDDVITSAGYRIGPAEIEECVLGHRAVAMVAAIGVPDELRGQVVKVFVKLGDSFAPSDELAEEIRLHVRSRLATYEYPREVEFLDELPMTTTGKVRRQALRATT